ncbi:RlmF-related methyltransferase [Vibrio lentus]|nr:RlmF-related methyltransferase [Vibrio lentus]
MGYSCRLFVSAYPRAGVISTGGRYSLNSDGEGEPYNHASVKALDIGVGANCIYPIIGATEYKSGVVLVRMWILCQ